MQIIEYFGHTQNVLRVERRLMSHGSIDTISQKVAPFYLDVNE